MRVRDALRRSRRRGEATVVLESRQHRDADDDRMIAYARRAGWVSRGVRYDFGSPSDECLLWLADVVAGAVALALTDDDEYLRRLGHVTVVAAS